MEDSQLIPPIRPIVFMLSPDPPKLVAQWTMVLLRIQFGASSSANRLSQAVRVPAPLFDFLVDWAGHTCPSTIKVQNQGRIVALGRGSVKA